MQAVGAVGKAAPPGRAGAPQRLKGKMDGRTPAQLRHPRGAPVHQQDHSHDAPRARIRGGLFQIRSGPVHIRGGLVSAPAALPRTRRGAPQQPHADAQRREERRAQQPAVGGGLERHVCARRATAGERVLRERIFGRSCVVRERIFGRSCVVRVVCVGFVALPPPAPPTPPSEPRRASAAATAADTRRGETFCAYACPVSTGGGTRRVQLVREEGRDASG